MTIPPFTQIAQFYGRVGPNQGQIEILLLNDTAVEQELLDIHPLTIEVNPERPVTADGELLMVAYLDPRVAYDVELVLKEEDKNLGFDGLLVVSNFDSQEAVDNLNSGWYESYNRYIGLIEEDDGLSGGQIAGIVVSPDEFEMDNKYQLWHNIIRGLV